jgi:hypothetical protein
LYSYLKIRTKVTATENTRKLLYNNKNIFIDTQPYIIDDSKNILSLKDPHLSHMPVASHKQEGGASHRQENEKNNNTDLTESFPELSFLGWGLVITDLSKYLCI